MWDIILEICRATVMGIFFGYLLLTGRKRGISQHEGWSYILVGFSLIFFGMIIDITNNFPSLNKFIIIGDTKYEAFLEKVVGYLFGFMFLAIGFIKWMPTIVALKETERMLERSSDELKILNEQLQKDIVDHERTEKALLNAAQQWRATFDGISDIVSLLDMEGRVLRCNKAMTHLIGKPFSEILNRPYWEIIYGKSAPMEKCPVIGMRQTLCRETGLVEMYGRWFNIAVDPVFDETGCLIGSVHIMSDVTDRKRAEEALRLFERAIETLQLGLTVTDSHGKIIYTNPAEAKMHGYQVEELIGKDVRILAPREIWDPLTVEQLLKMKSWKRESINIRKDGSMFSVYLLSVVVPNVPGDAWGVITTCEDITERKKAEEALKESEDLYRDLVECSQYLICTHDLKGQILSVNKEGAKLLGYEQRNLLNKSIRDLLVPEVRDEFDKYLDTIQRHGVAKGLMLLQTATGEKRIWEYSNTLRTEGVAAPIVRAMAHDVTERMRTEKAVTKLSQENAIMAEIGRIISSSFDINEVYDRFAEEVNKLIPFDRIVINIIDIEKSTVSNVYMAGQGISDREIGEIYPLEGSGNAEMVRTKSSLLIQPEDFDEYKNRFPMLLSTFQAGFRSIMNVPLFSKGRVIGGLLLRSLKPYAYTDKDVRLAERVGNQVAGAIANAQLFIERIRAEKAATRLSQENAIMAEIGRIISSSLNIDEVYERFSEEVRKLISFDRIVITMINPKDDTTFINYISGIDVESRRFGDVVPTVGTATGECIRMRSNLLFQTESIDEVINRFPGLLPTFKAGLRSMIFVPLISKDQVIGVLSLRATKPNAYTEGDLKLVERVGNQIAGAIANAQLFIERKRVEEALRQSEEKYRTILENMQEGYLEVDLAGHFTFVNNAECRNLGYTSEELIGMNYRQYTDETTARKLYQTFNGVYRTGESLKVLDVEVIRKDGTKALNEISVSLIRDSEGKPIGFRGVSRDVTERKRAEEALRKSETKFQKLFDEAPVGYQEIDSEGRIIRINRTELDMLGYTAEEMLGRYVWEFITDEESRQKVKGKLAGTIPTGRAFDRPFQRKDGTTFPAVMEDRALLDSEGKITGIRATIQDVTERKRAEEEKALLQEQLRQSQKMEAIGKLAGGVAHDFNNLLTVIQGYSELILKGLNSDNRLCQDVREILNASERASSLTRQLLAFSRKQVLQPKVLDLNLHVSNMDKMLRRMIGEDIELVTLLAKDLGRIKADPGQIEQVILNLAVNAKDAMLSGGKLTIETANVELDENYARSHIIVTPGNYVILSVSDTGVGMTPEIKERIFEPFFTTKEKGKGTGLGLSTVYGIVQQSGGNIWVYSEPGLGTTFKIYLPRIEEGTESFRPAAVSTKPLGGSETILLVEDEEMVRKLACTVLEKNGYRVLEAPNGEEALRIAQEHSAKQIHLMITDVVMPRMSGRELADCLESVRPEMKVLYMSGYTDDAIIHHGVLDPGIAYIQKPFAPDVLALKVREVLDGS